MGELCGQEGVGIAVEEIVEDIGGRAQAPGDGMVEGADQRPFERRSAAIAPECLARPLQVDGGIGEMVLAGQDDAGHAGERVRRRQGGLGRQRGFEMGARIGSVAGQGPDRSGEGLARDRMTDGVLRAEGVDHAAAPRGERAEPNTVAGSDFTSAPFAAGSPGFALARG